MANQENDFRKLLGDAPMAPDADTVTVIGILARTHDAARFMLTLPNGQSETLDVAAVKSARTIAGAIGQSVVQLELDAHHIPEKMRDAIKNAAFPPLPLPYGFGPLGPYGGPDGPNSKVFGDPSYAPFVAALPHQADPATIGALASYGNRTYFNPYIWANDHQHLPVRVHADPMPDPHSYFRKLPFVDGPKRPIADGTIPIPYPPYHTSDY